MSTTTTQLREYYKALHALKEEEQTALATFHVHDPQFLLAHRFEESVKALQHVGIDEAFYPKKRGDSATPRTSVQGIHSTIDFVSQIWDGEARTVEGAPELSFCYVDRELFALRSTGEERAASRRLDLLLANGVDGAPILAELKTYPDKPAYFALIQGLMHASEFLIPKQRERLSNHYDGVLASPTTMPRGDLYLIAFRSQDTSENRRCAFVATEKIAARLIANERFCRVVRRIAYIDVREQDDQLVFTARFAHRADD